MNFQDSLKSSLKTKEEVYSEQLMKERQNDLSYADTCVGEIENKFLDMAARGDYIMVGGIEVIKSLFTLTRGPIYLKSTQSFTEGKRYLDENDTITVQYNERHRFFINTLKERLAEDNIQITREYLARVKYDINPSGSRPLPISEWLMAGYPPVTFKGYECNYAKEARLIIECQTSVPKDYSEEFKTYSQMNTHEAVDPDDTGEYQKPVTDFDSMEGHQFEAFCAELLSKNGFTDVEKTQGSGDQGVDIIAFRDGVKFGIQCKCYSSDVGNKAVQEVFTGKAYYHCHVVAILTNSHFTQYAKELAHMNNVILWDREKLLEFIENADKIDET